VNAVHLRNVTKRYGQQIALRGLDLDIPEGAVSGLIGPNGAGKTTTMGLLAGLLRADSGEINILGNGPFSAAKHAGRISLMPQDSAPSAYMPIRDVLCFYAELQGLTRKEARKEADRTLDNVSLTDRARARFGELSHGMRRRFSVAQALLGTPQLVLLDEPTSGLDPELVVQIRELFVALRGKATLLISSHILSELEAICDHVVFMEAGKCIRQGRMGEVTGAASIVRITLTDAPDFAALRSALPGCTLEWTKPQLTVRAPDNQALRETNALALRCLLDQNIGILEVEAGKSLESTYLEARARQ
jgi:ABC-2 type transport system ATP-binding protein